MHIIMFLASQHRTYGAEYAAQMRHILLYNAGPEKIHQHTHSIDVWVARGATRTAFLLILTLTMRQMHFVLVRMYIYIVVVSKCAAPAAAVGSVWGSCVAHRLHVVVVCVVRKTACHVSRRRIRMRRCTQTHAGHKQHYAHAHKQSRNSGATHIRTFVLTKLYTDVPDDSNRITFHNQYKYVAEWTDRELVNKQTNRISIK